MSTDDFCTDSIDGIENINLIKIEPHFEHSDSLDAQLSYYDSSNINEHEDLTRANENEAAEDDSEQSRDDQQTTLRKTQTAKEKKIDFEQLFAENQHRFDMSCDLCSKLFRTLGDARCHYATEHKNPRGYIKCCNEKLVYRCKIISHIYRHLDPHKFKCELCDKSYLTLGALKTHIKKHNEVPVAREKNEYICDICKKAFTSKDYLKRHFQWHSERNKSNDEQYNIFISDNFDMNCDQCNGVFATFYDAKRHYKDVHNEKNGYIKCCGAKLHQFWRVIDHINSSHLNPKKFKCELCNKNYGDRKKLYLHNRRHKEAIEKPFICDYCGRHFRNKEIIRRHILTIHTQIEPKFECETCHKRFRLVALLRNHYYSVHREKKAHVTCEICGKHFNVKANFHKHMLQHVEKSERLAQRKQCDQCGEWLMTKSGMYYHETIHRSGVQKCDQCQMELPHRLALLAHIRKHHRQPQFKCTLCEKTFDIRSSLKKHERNHTRQNIYPCLYCSKKFVVLGSRQSHERRMHPMELNKRKQMRKMLQYPAS